MNLEGAVKCSCGGRLGRVDAEVVVEEDLGKGF